ncbi:MAG: FAD-binding protein [Candidatus Thermoplasmatota archaeon]|nr:FAD-binding protein [Candidatus Thermoplasmatota archaeon]
MLAVNEYNMAGKSSKSEWSAKKPYFTKITDNFVLNGESSRKETRHIVFDLGDSGLEYKAGDALGVVPRCPPGEVEEILRICGFSGEEIVETNLGDCSLRDALTDRYEIHRVSKKWIKGLAERSGGDAPKSEIRIVSRKRSSSVDGALIVDWSSTGEGDVPEGYVEMGEMGDNSAILLHELISDNDAMEDYIWSRDYVDALGDFASFGFTPQQLLEGMDRLKPRLYSIASSPEFEEGTVHLTVAIVRYSHHGRDRTGLCTGFMADRCETNATEVGVYMSPTRSFVLPEDGTKDIIMVGPGTGIAPFRAFLQQREINGDSGRNWLFFGDWTEEGEYLYRDEMGDWKDRGIISRHDLAWSRQGSEKVYVQHLMEKNGEEIWNWIDGGAYFYVCGDKQYMAKDVHSTLIGICSEFGGMSPEDAKDFVETGLMKTEKRYLRDVY